MVGVLLKATITASMRRCRMDERNLADALGVRVDVINRWMEDPKAMPIEAVADIARAFGVTPSFLFSGHSDAPLRGFHEAR